MSDEEVEELAARLREAGRILGCDTLMCQSVERQLAILRETERRVLSGWTTMSASEFFGRGS